MIVLKSQSELAKMRRAGRIVADVLAALAEMAKPGLTTAALDARATAMTAAAGAVPAFKGYNGFPAALCTSVNEEVVHGIPGKRRLLEGDLLSLDFGAVYEGYYADAALTVPIGSVSPEAARLLDVTRESLARGVAAARAGNRLSAIGRAVQTFVEAAGYAVVRKFVGHGIGQAMHEEPQVPNFVLGRLDYDPVLRPGMTLAIEPMVNAGGYQVQTKPDGWTVITRDRSLSAHFEHTVHVTDGEPEIITL
ncbi:MAG: type I methionyl aminopeptidase [Patescibacteria group bacterium]